MFDNIYIQVGIAISVVVVAFAFVKGDEPERLGSAAYSLVYIGTLMIKDDRSLSTPQWGVMGMDVVLLVVFIGLAAYSRRGWLVWASAFQALIVTGHLLVAANLRPPSDAFATVNNMSNYGLLIALGVGTFWAWQERRAAALGLGDI